MEEQAKRHSWRDVAKPNPLGGPPIFQYSICRHCEIKRKRPFMERPVFQYPDGRIIRGLTPPCEPPENETQLALF